MINVCLNEGKNQMLIKLIAMIFVIQIVGLALYSITHFKLQHLHFRQSSGIYIETERRSKRCFFLSRNKLNLTEFAYSAAKNFPLQFRNYAPQSWMKDAVSQRHVLCKRFVMLKEIKGRTGNQMFQVASLIGMAYKYDAIPIIPDNIPLVKYFKLPNIVAHRHFRKIKDVITCECKRSAVYYNCSKEFNSGNNVSLHGHLQSWKYFEEVDHTVRDIFRYETVHVKRARKFLESIRRPGYQLVCIHVRRGDFTETRYRREGFITANISFIKNARAFYEKRYVNVSSIVVSDDKAWCRENVKNIILSPFIDPGDDMGLLMLCDHVIVTSGTFGWWGAWLSGGTTRYFNGYPVPGSSLSTRVNRQDYYPLHWIGLS